MLYLLVLVSQLLLTGYMLFLLILMFRGFWHLLDSSFRTQLRASGIVIRKCYAPASQHLMFIPSGLITLAVPAETSERCDLLIRIDIKSGWISVNSKFYNLVSVNDHVDVTYCLGRFSNQLHLNNVRRCCRSNDSSKKRN